MLTASLKENATKILFVMIASVVASLKVYRCPVRCEGFQMLVIGSACVVNYLGCSSALRQYETRNEYIPSRPSQEHNKRTPTELDNARRSGADYDRGTQSEPNRDRSRIGSDRDKHMRTQTGHKREKNDCYCNWRGFNRMDTADGNSLGALVIYTSVVYSV